MPFVYSTLTNNHMYTNWVAPGEKSMIRIIVGKPVLIKGGANLADVENPKFAPKGVVTEVTEDQLGYLEQNSMFRKHKQKGLIVVANERLDPERVAAASMEPKDNSAPLTPDSEIFQKVDADGNTIKPVTEKTGIVDRVKSAVGLK